MKKLISFSFILVVLMMFTACNNANDAVTTGPAKIYYDYLISKGEIEAQPYSLHGGDVQKFDVNELYYFLDDFNYDGIIDLAISAEASDSNGIEIYTLKDELVTPLLSKHMPYSAGVEIFTLAKCDDKYGIKRLRQNSMGDFTYYAINKDGSLKSIFYGESYDPNGVALKDADNYDKMKPITFFNIEQLKKMC